MGKLLWYVTSNGVTPFYDVSFYIKLETPQQFNMHGGNNNPLDGRIWTSVTDKPLPGGYGLCSRVFPIYLSRVRSVISRGLASPIKRAPGCLVPGSAMAAWRGYQTRRAPLPDEPRLVLTLICWVSNVKEALVSVTAYLLTTCWNAVFV